MKRVICSFLLIALPLMSQEDAVVPERPPPREEVAGFASRDATVLSMMGWGIALAVGFAALVSLIDNHEAPPADVGPVTTQ